MVESKPKSGLESIVKNQKLMTVIVLFPFFKPWELARFCQFNKAYKELLLRHVNFQVLFEAWGIILTPAEMEETYISTSIALKLAAKKFILKSIKKSKHMIAREAIKILRRKEIVPKISKLEAKSFEELTKLRIKQV